MKQCPEDQQELSLSDSEGHFGYRCPTCSGTWLPNNYVVSIAHERSFDSKTFLDSLAGSTKGESSKRCPEDGSALAVAQVQGIELDWCRACKGVWFDTGEVSRLLANHERKELGDAMQFLAMLPW